MRRRLRSNPDWRELVSNPDDIEEFSARDVPGIARSAVDRVVASGAVTPLEYIGEGMTALVFCDARGIAFKVARTTDYTTVNIVEAEAEYLAVASTVPGVREHVVRFRRWHPAPLAVIERECVRAQPGRRRRLDEGELFDLHQRLAAIMRPYGWGRPELKGDSYVFVRGRGPILVDAGWAHRRGVNLARHVARMHRRDVSSALMDSARWEIRMELGDSIERSAGQRLHDRLERMRPPERANPQLLRGRVVTRHNGPKYKPLRKQLPDDPPSMGYSFTGYHATSVDKWPSIRKKGLVPGATPPTGQDWLGKYSGKAIYYHTTLPLHEIDNAFESDTGELINIVIECSIRVYALYVVPDEEFGTPAETNTVLQSGGPVAVGMRLPPEDIIAVHVPDTASARRWAASANAPRVVFHAV